MIKIFLCLLIAIPIISRLALLITNKVNEYNDSQSGQSTNDTKSFSKQTNPNSADIDTKILSCFNHFYWKKDSFMTPNESRMFFYIQCALDELFAPEKRKNYYIFPQVSLHSFIGTSKDLSQFENSAALNHLLRKNVDFIICECISKKQYTKGTDNKDLFFFAYEPVLMIELDGSSHFDEKKYGLKDYTQQKKSDAFKKALSSHLQLPLINYLLANDKIEVTDRPKIKEMIANIL